MPWYAWLVAALPVGIGFVWWMTKRLNQAEADRIEKLSHQNYTQGAAEAKAAEVAVTNAAEKAKRDAKTADPSDW